MRSCARVAVVPLLLVAAARAEEAPPDAEALRQLSSAARTLVYVKDCAAALPKLDVVLRGPPNALAYALRGECRDATGDADGARADRVEALKKGAAGFTFLDPPDLLVVAHAYEGTGEPREAASWLHRYAQLWDPSVKKPDRDAARRRSEELDPTLVQTGPVTVRLPGRSLEWYFPWPEQITTWDEAVRTCEALGPEWNTPTGLDLDETETALENWLRPPDDGPTRPVWTRETQRMPTFPNARAILAHIGDYDWFRHWRLATKDERALVVCAKGRSKEAPYWSSYRNFMASMRSLAVRAGAGGQLGTGGVGVEAIVWQHLHLGLAWARSGPAASLSWSTNIVRNEQGGGFGPYATLVATTHRATPEAGLFDGPPALGVLGGVTLWYPATNVVSWDVRLGVGYSLGAPLQFVTWPALLEASAGLRF